MADLKRTELSVDRERAVLVGVILPGSNADPRDPLGELASLAKTAGAAVAAQVIQRRQRPDAGTYIGSGKAIEIAQLALHFDANVVLFDNDLSPAQIGKLETIINQEAKKPLGQGIKVLDRSELILDIFATRAQTSEAKLQVELAQMQYTYPRLTRMWGHLERLAGGGGSLGIGTRGPGETQLEIDRRLVRKRIKDLNNNIEAVQARKTRTVEHRNRQHFTVCIVGYTNAGKSTLFNTLTAAGTYADDKLFATLDTKTRQWKLDRTAGVMLSDTVGFVRDLPHGLVASFKATLEEAVHADLLLHVLDVGHPHARQQLAAVRTVLEEIGVKGKAELLLLNKIDSPEGEAALPEWRAIYADAIPVSAKTGEGLGRLLEAVAAIVHGQRQVVVVDVDAADGKLLSRLEQAGGVVDRGVREDRIRLTLELPGAAVERLRREPGVTFIRENDRHDI